MHSDKGLKSAIYRQITYGAHAGRNHNLRSSFHTKQAVSWRPSRFVDHRINYLVWAPPLTGLQRVPAVERCSDVHPAIVVSPGAVNSLGGSKRHSIAPAAPPVSTFYEVCRYNDRGPNKLLVATHLSLCSSRPSPVDSLDPTVSQNVR